MRVVWSFSSYSSSRGNNRKFQNTFQNTELFLPFVNCLEPPHILAYWQKSMLSWGMRSLTHSDICFPQEVYYSTSCVRTGSLFSTNLYTWSERWSGSRHCEPSGSVRTLCCVSTVPRREGRREMIVQKNIHSYTLQSPFLSAHVLIF